MAIKKKFMKTLTRAQQRRSIKGIKKPKKNIIKNYLESPFTLEWPNITIEHEGNIISLLQKSCTALKKLDCKPPWKEVSKYRGAERKAFLKEFRQKFQESLNPDDKRQNKEREKVLSNLIFGYNAVMRALESDRIAGILVKKNVEPSFITKSFLPGCANKLIPLIPLNDLDGLLKSEETLALPHACLVLGLKPSAREQSNSFHPLFTKMCEAVSIEVEDVDEDSDGEDEEGNVLESPTEGDSQKNKSSESTHQLTEAEIQLYHLKRVGKARRAFTPGGKEEKVESLNSAPIFIGFQASDAQSTLTLQQGDKVPQNSTGRKPENLKLPDTRRSDFKDLDVSSMFFIDASGEEDGGEAVEGLKKSLNGGSQKGKRKAKPYVPGRIKRLKGNPNRKSS